MVAFDSFTMDFQPRTRVNAALLPKYSGKPVILLGIVQQIDSTSSNVKVQTSDGEMIVVRLEVPLQKNLEGVAEFHGIAQGKQMTAKLAVSLPCQSVDEFDMQAYDDAIKLIHSLEGNPWLLE